MPATMLPAVPAAVLLVSLLPSLWLRLQRLTLLDCFLLSIAVYLGAYTIADVLAVDSDVRDSVIVLVIFSIVGAATGILWFFARHPTPLIEATALWRMRADWQAAPAWAVLASIGVALLDRWARSAFIGEELITGTPEELEQIDARIPYWLTSLAHVAFICLFPAVLCAWGKFRASAGAVRLFWLLIAGVGALMLLGFGRRTFFALLVIVGWDVISSMRRRRVLAMAVIVAAMPALFLLSNLYQAYRVMAHRGVVIEELAPQDVSIEDAFDMSRTISNLQERPSLWRFNYEVAKAHVDEKGDLMWGRLFLSGLPSYIPAVLWPGKVPVETEVILLDNFGLEQYDRGENIFVDTYAEFGVASALVAPALILFFVCACGVVLRWLRDPFIRSMLMGSAIFYALNLETGYLGPVGMARELTVIAAVYLVGRAMIATMRFLAPRPA